MKYLYPSVLIDEISVFSGLVKLCFVILGDPTGFGDLRVPKVFEDKLVEVIRSGEYNGYQNSFGREDTRRAIAVVTSHPNAPLTADVLILLFISRASYSF